MTTSTILNMLKPKVMARRLVSMISILADLALVVTSMLLELILAVILIMDPSGVVALMSMLMETISLPMVMSTRGAVSLLVLVVTLVPSVLMAATKMMVKVVKNSLVVSLLVDQPSVLEEKLESLAILATMMLERKLMVVMSMLLLLHLLRMDMLVLALINPAKSVSVLV